MVYTVASNVMSCALLCNRCFSQRRVCHYSVVGWARGNSQWREWLCCGEVWNCLAVGVELLSDGCGIAQRWGGGISQLWGVKLLSSGRGIAQ